MVKRHWLIFIFCLPSILVTGQDSTLTRNVVIVTLDGLRWQEVFNGADSSILFNKAYVQDRDAIRSLWTTSPADRRKIVMPFLWNVLATNGQLYGNRNLDSRMDCANHQWFSYPGYSELMVGHVNRKIRSNAAKENPLPTVLEFIGNQPGFEQSVAAFATWDVMSFILREGTSSLPVNAGRESATGELSETELLLNQLQETLPEPHGGRYDAVTFFYALEYMKRASPRVIFIGLDETDQHGHGGRYDKYLDAASRADKMIGMLWRWIESDPRYRDQTTLVVTTDHGRGRNAAKGWRRHGLTFPGSGEIWMAVMGPDTPALGEIQNSDRYYQEQIAKTIAALLGLDYTNVVPVGDMIPTVISTPGETASESSRELVSCND